MFGVMRFVLLGNRDLKMTDVLLTNGFRDDIGHRVRISRVKE